VCLKGIYKTGAHASMSLQQEVSGASTTNGHIETHIAANLVVVVVVVGGVSYCLVVKICIDKTSAHTRTCCRSLQEE
jgi:hypothetical protein